MIAGAHISDPETATEVVRFAGRSGQLFADRDRFYSVGGDGLEIWDLLSGSRTGVVPGLRPVAHHRGAAELAAIVDDALVRWATHPRA